LPAWTVAEQAEADCAGACRRLHVPWELSRGHEHLAASITEMVRPAELFVFGQALAPAQKKALLRPAMHNGGPAILVCPDSWSPLHRVLVVDEGRRSNDRFLGFAAELAGWFQAKAMVLTVARSERAARRRQRSAREALGSRGQEADFDLVVGSAVPAAVANVARWRRCQLVVMERHERRPWWPWAASSTTETLMELPHDLTLLALPQSGIPETASERPPAASLLPHPGFDAGPLGM